MNIKITIIVEDADTDTDLWQASVSGDTKYLRGAFEAAEMELGKIERHLPDEIQKMQDDHEDDVVGVGDEPQHHNED